MRERTSEQQFNDVYSSWKKREVEFRHYSKTAPLKELPEYKAFLELDESTVPQIEEKMRLDDGFDFVLCDVVIQLKGWDPDEFTAGDVGKRAREVLDKLGSAGE